MIGQINTILSSAYDEKDLLGDTRSFPVTELCSFLKRSMPQKPMQAGAINCYLTDLDGDGGWRMEDGVLYK